MAAYLKAATARSRHTSAPGEILPQGLGCLSPSQLLREDVVFRNERDQPQGTLAKPPFIVVFGTKTYRQSRCIARHKFVCVSTHRLRAPA